MRKPGLNLLFQLSLILLFAPTVTFGQTLPEILTTGTVNEQIDYINERTRIYDNFRAIREDMFQAVTQNALDTLAAAKSEISSLTLEGRVLDMRIDSLNRILENTRGELEEVTSNKNNIEVLGMGLNKTTYNLFMWGLAGALAILLVIGWLSFKRSLAVTRYTKKELDELKEEFETYRRESREAREKLVLSHFNEVKKLRGG
jgi:DNA repair exonuclease SbcCD ATPase subunit